MTHFFFHLSECGVVTKDYEGREMADLDAARRSALHDARDIMANELYEGRMCLSCHIDIVSAQGDPLLRVPFKDAITIIGL
jgi:hypothetical protein